jgi:group I intron endonuclease
MGVIYKLTHISGKSYIGYTKHFEIRMNQHKNCKNGQMISRAIQKYGWAEFNQEVIFESDDETYLLKECESFYIKKFDTKNNGYNMTDGGDGVIDFDGKIAKKISITLKGHKVSKETRDKISKSLSGKKYKDGRTSSLLGKKPWNKGKKMSIEYCEKNRQVHLGKKISQETREKLKGKESASKEYSFMTPNGEIIYFRNLSKFCKSHKLSISNMCSLAKGKRKSCGGYTYVG